jgi:hypothetical protein
VSSPNPFGAPVDQEFDFDLTDVKEGGGLPVGVYVALLSDVRQTTSGNNNPQVEWEFQVIQGPQNGRTMVHYTVMTEKAMFRVAEVSKALGLGDIGSRVRFRKADALGRKAIITVEDNEYTDRRDGTRRKNTRITSVKPLSGDTQQQFATSPSGLPR